MRFRCLSIQIAAALLICLPGIRMTAQTWPVVGPVRGFQPAYTYALDGIESINVSTGAVGFNIPLASLPPGPGGLTANLQLVYSNKYLNATRLNVPAPQPQYDLKSNPASGWRINFGYSLAIEPSSDFGCDALSRLRVILPDGSEHRMLKATSNAQDVCQGVTYPPADGTTPVPAQSWYSADGTFLRLDVNATSASAWPAGAGWALYFNDGSRVVTGADLVQTFFDRNGNWIEYRSAMGAAMTKTITDQFGRAITITRTAAAGMQPDIDTVTMAGYKGAALTWSIEYGGSQAVDLANGSSGREGQYLCGGTGEYCLFDPGAGVPAVSRVVLPNQLEYRFDYQARMGEVSRITLPSGATVDYTYALDNTRSGVPAWDAIMANAPVSRVLTHRDENSGTLLTETWTYSFPNANALNGATGMSTITAPDGGVTKHWFYGVDYRAQTTNSGLIFKTQREDLSYVEKVWGQNVPTGTTVQSDYPNNRWVQQEFESLGGLQSSQAKTRLNTVDANGNQTSSTEYDWIAYSTVPHDAAGAPSLLSTGVTALRLTERTYANSATRYHSNTGVNLLNLAASEKVSTGAGTVVRLAQYGRDTHGNVTDEYQWDSEKSATVPATLSSGNSARTQHTYDGRGNPVTTTDPRNFAMTLGYGMYPGCTAVPAGFSDGCSGLYLTDLKTATGQTEQRHFTYEYDLSSGAKTKTTDADNSVVTTVDYDNFARPTKTTEAGLREVNTTYLDAERCVITQRDLAVKGDKALASIAHFDQLGRIRLEQTLETGGAQASCTDASGITVQTKYRRDSTGSYRMFSNPYGAMTAGGPEGISGWTRVTADTLGRTVGLETMADAAPPSSATSMSANPTGKTVNAYSENTVMVTDQAGRSRTMTQNALGQLAQVDAGGVSTFYKYTVAGDLTDVCQNGTWISGVCQPAAQAQARSFVYTSLGRLKSATNPESGTLTYTYDANGNVLTKTDQRPMTVTWTYDGQNRPVTKDYSSDLGGSGTIFWCYDGTIAGNCAGAAAGSYLKGRLTMVKNNVATNVYGAYDALGRVTGSSVTVGGTAYPFTYAYNLADGLMRQSYPSGKVVSQEYDGAGRVNRMHQGEPGSMDGASQYVKVSQYSSAGQILGAVRGPDALGLTETAMWNTRQQMSLYAVKSGAAVLMNLGFGYCNTAGLDICGENNGNLLRQTIGRNAGQTNAFSETQTYGYDSLNRIVSAGASGWSESYGHDEFGNTWWTATASASPDLSKPVTSGWFSGNKNQASDPNRAGQYGFDLAGNNTGLSGAAIVYDGDGHQVRFMKSGTDAFYAYDGEGRRVRAAVNSQTPSIYVHDAAGELAAEYGGAAGAQAGVVYVFGDHLGSTRLTVDDRGAVSAFDYLPYGEALVAGRTAAQGYSDPANWLKVKFTGKERDSDSGLDYFGARYFSGAQGRWTSADWSGAPQAVPYADLRDPQSLNLYGFVLNNPLSHLDADGHEVDLTNTDAKQRAETEKRILSNVNKNERELFTTTTDKNGRTRLVLDKEAAANFDGKHSSGYRMLNQAINAKAVASVEINDHPTMPDGHSINTGSDAGGGRTVTFANGNSSIYLSTAGDQSGIPLYGMSHQVISNPVGIIAGHELLGHGRLHMLGQPSGEGAAVGVENQLRKEQGLPLRLPGYN